MSGILPVAILAGGIARRLYPVTVGRPKALVEVNGEPFLMHQLRLLKSKGVTRVVLCLGHLGEIIEDWARKHAPLPVEFSHDGPNLLGTAGAVKKALPLLGSAFCMMYGDSYLPCDFAAVRDAFVRSRKRALMVVYQNEDRWDKSNVEYAGGRILAYDKANRTERMHHIDYGLAVFHASAFEGVPPGVEYDLARLYRDLLAQGELAGYEVHERFYEIGSFEGIRDLSKFLSRR